MRRLIFLFIWGVFLLGAAAEQREIWLAPRPDSKPGKGIESDPFNANSAGKFDKILRRFNSNTRFHLKPGEYKTTGAYITQSGEGFFLGKDCSLVGSGMDWTTLKLVKLPIPTHTVVVTDIYVDSHAEVSDLTVDCNWPRLGKRAKTSINAIALHGNHCAVRRVRVRNAYGSWGYSEAFTIKIGAWLEPDSKQWQPVQDELIEECEVRDWCGNYGGAILIFGQVQDGRRIAASGIMRHNKVTGYRGIPISTTAFGAVGEGIVIEDNLAQDCDNGFYADSQFLQKLTIRNNRFLGCRRTGVRINCTGKEQLYDGIVIENNEIAITCEPKKQKTGFNLSSSYEGTIGEVTVLDNRFTSTSRSADVGRPVGIDVSHASPLKLIDNIFAPEMIHSILRTARLEGSGNRTSNDRLIPMLNSGN